MISKTAPLERSSSLLLQASNTFFSTQRSFVADMQHKNGLKHWSLKRKAITHHESWATHM